jgi:hypothetical protein
MTPNEGPLSERVGARISPELKQHVHDLIGQRGFDSEADIVRAALWQYVGQNDGQPQQVQLQLGQVDLHDDHKSSPDGDGASADRIEWILSVVLILIALVGSKTLNALREEKIKPAELADEAIQEAIYNRSILLQKLRAARRAVLHLDRQDAK